MKNQTLWACNDFRRLILKVLVFLHIWWVNLRKPAGSKVCHLLIKYSSKLRKREGYDYRRVYLRRLFMDASHIFSFGVFGLLGFARVSTSWPRAMMRCTSSQAHTSTCICFNNFLFLILAHKLRLLQVSLNYLLWQDDRKHSPWCVCLSQTVLFSFEPLFRSHNLNVSQCIVVVCIV